MTALKVRPHGRRGQRVRPPSAGQRYERLCFDAALVVALVAMPLAMGGRHPLGQCLLTLAAILATAAWLMRVWLEGHVTWHWSVVDGLFAAAVAIGIAQVVPLPAGVIDAVSPRLAALLPCWSNGAWTLGRWNTLSLTPGETITGLEILLAQAVFVAILAQRVRTSGEQEVERLLAVVAVATGLLAALGVVQYLAGNGKYLWFYEFVHNDAGGIVKGTFTNRNHYASFLAAGCGAVAWWAVSARDAGRNGRRSFGAVDPYASQRRLAAGLVVLAAVVFAVLSSLSRGGFVALASAVTVCVGLLLRAGAIQPLAAVGVVAAGIGVFAALEIHGMDQVTGRLDTFFDDVHRENGFGRLEVWRAACRAIEDFPWLGTGVGSHADVAQRYMPPTGSTVFTHAENSYLNLGVETGVVGLALALAAVGFAVAACVAISVQGDARERGIAAALAAALAAGIVHAGTDFIWYVPACSTLLMALGACALVLGTRRVTWLPATALRFDRATATIMAGGVFVLLLGCGVRQITATQAEPVWEESIRQSRELAESAGRPPAEIRESLDRRIALLEQVTSYRPDHPQAWAALSIARLERFGLSRRMAGSSLGLIDLQEAAAAGKFGSIDEVRQWVRKVAGSHYGDLTAAADAARRAVTINPLAGEAWCVLGRVAFLSERDPTLSGVFIDQALLVRPSNALVLFEAACQAELDGDDERAGTLWQQSFGASREQRDRILALLVPLVPAVEASRMLAPDLAGLRAIDAAWSPRSSVEEMRPVREQRLASVQAAAEKERGAARCGLLMEAAALKKTLGDAQGAQASLAAAVAANPANYQAHLALADQATATGAWDVAKHELEWCLLRRPDSPALRGRLNKLAQGGGAMPGSGLRPPRTASSAAASTNGAERLR